MTTDFAALHAQLNAMGPQKAPDGSQETDALNAWLKSQNAQTASGTGPQPAFDKIQSLTQGRGDAEMSDPYLTAALKRFQGDQGPYTPDVTNQLINRSADSTAGAASQQAESLRQQMAQNGGSMADPAAMAALRGIQSTQQQQNTANQGDIRTNAALQNYQAQMNSTNNMASLRMGQNNAANSQYNQGAAYYAQLHDQGQHVNATGGNYAAQANAYRPQTGNPYAQQQPAQPAPQPAAPHTAGQSTPNGYGGNWSNAVINGDKAVQPPPAQGQYDYSAQANQYAPPVFNDNGGYNSQYGAYNQGYNYPTNDPMGLYPQQQSGDNDMLQQYLSSNGYY